jgi:hypothetical protein
MKSFLLYLDEEGVSDFIQKIDSYVNDPKKLHQDYPDFFDSGKKNKDKEDVSAKKTIMAIRKRIRHLIDEGKGLHSKSSDLAEKVFEYLKQGKTVIIDLSLKDNMDASIISTILVRKLFDNNKENFTSDQPENVINTVIIVEEAQNVLSEEFVKSNANPFVRVAKKVESLGWGWLQLLNAHQPSQKRYELRQRISSHSIWATQMTSRHLSSRISTTTA